jgi:hypothetical protein
VFVGLTENDTPNSRIFLLLLLSLFIFLGCVCYVHVLRFVVDVDPWMHIGTVYTPR